MPLGEEKGPLACMVRNKSRRYQYGISHMSTTFCLFPNMIVTPDLHACVGHAPKPAGGRHMEAGDAGAREH